MDILLLALRILLAGLLYAFLGVVLLMLWRDLRGTTAQRSGTRPSGRLMVMEAEEAGEHAAGQTAFRLQAVTSIGRAPTNTVVIDDTYASSHHALLTWREGHWWLEDRDSRNGTRLNGQPVEKPVIVSTGDVIRLGNTRLVLQVD